MKPSPYSRTGFRMGLALLILLALPLGRVSAQALFEAPLALRVDSQDVRKGAVLGTLNGQTLRLLGAFDGLQTPWVQADLYLGDPDDGGTLIQNLALLLSDPHALGGGFDQTVTLSPEQVQDLQNGLLYITIRTANGDRARDLNGQIRLSSLVDPAPKEAPLTHIWQGWPVARGSVQALRTPQGLRLVGFFNSLASNWQQIVLYRGAHGAERVQVGSLFYLSGSGLSAGFDHTFGLEAGWEQDLQDGLFSVEVYTSRVGDGLRGQILSGSNQAPATSQVLTPAAGETLLIGAPGGTTPVHPDEVLATVTFTPAPDPDLDPVGYLWQVSLRPEFNSIDQTRTLDFGVSEAGWTLTVGDAATLFDALLGRAPGEILLDEPVTVYHRMLTTDGARYALGPTVETTFIRGAITANEPVDGLPGAFRLHGNYPNPFNPTTTITFDLPEAADVTVAVFNLMGQRVLTVPAGVLAAGTQHRVPVDAASLPSGSYLYQVIAQRESTVQQATGKMILLK